MTASAAPVLLTGSIGYIGSALAAVLPGRGIEYVGVDKRPHSGEREECFNLAEAERTRALVTNVSPSVIIHTGTNSALAYQRDFIATFQEDAEALVNLLGSIRSFPDTRFVFFSSSYVYSGVPVETPVSESTIVNPSHNFGVAKSFFEQFVLRNHPQSVVFRLSSVFGKGEQVHPNAVGQMVREAMETDRVTVWGKGQRRMQYVLVDDVVEYILEALDLPPGIYNLGGAEYTSVAVTARTIAEHFGVELEFLEDKREGDTLPLMNTAKLRAASRVPHDTPLPTALSGYLRGFGDTRRG